MLRKDVLLDKGKRGMSEKRSSVGAADSALWNALRAKRRELADAQDVPPYIIFSDATLMAMVEARPRNHQQLGRLSGIGQRKLELYGDDFLEVLAAFDDGSSGHEIVSDTVSQTLECFKLGYSVEQVASQRGLTVDTVYNHLAKALEQGAVRTEDVLTLSASEFADIEAAILALPDEQRNALKPVFEAFGGTYGYGLLRCVRAALLRRLT